MADDPGLDKLPALANTVSEFISLKVSEDMRTSDLLSHQIQLKIESTRLLKEEYETRLGDLDQLRQEQKRMVTEIPEYAIELEHELRKVERDMAEMRLHLKQTLEEIDRGKETLRALEISESQRIASAEAMFRRHKQLVQAWENALALRIEPHTGYLKITYTDINRSFQLIFKDSQVHIEQEGLPQAVVGRVADQFNENGAFAELAVNMREAFLAQSSS